jgi:uncharacterized membrane protein
MTKIQFLLALNKALSGLPQDEIEERLTFYSEMIDDRMEEGHSEEEAIAAIGSVEEIVAQSVEEIPLAKIVKNKVKPKRKMRAWEIVLLAVGSPIWLSLAIAAFAVIFSIYVVLWSVVISLWAAQVSLIASAVAGVLVGIAFVFTANPYAGLFLISAGLVCGGLSIFLFYGCKAATVGVVWLTKKIVLWIKHCLIRKEDAK